jgi:hypothetical protein
LDVESVESAVSNGNGSGVVSDSLAVVGSVLHVLTVVTVALIPEEGRLVATTVLPSEVNRVAIVGELNRLSEGRRSS